jgi:hypothetical protein
VVRVKIIARNNLHRNAPPRRQKRALCGYANREKLCWHHARNTASPRRHVLLPHESFWRNISEPMSVAKKYRSKLRQDRQTVIRTICVGAVTYTMVVGFAIVVYLVC